MSALDANALMTAILTSAASTAGSQVGGTVGSAVFSQVAGALISVIGIPQGPDLTQVQTTLTAIQTQLTNISSQITALQNSATWNAINTSLSNAKTLIEPMFNDLVTIINGNSNNAALRDQLLTANLKTHNTDALQQAMSSIHDAIMGSSSGPTVQSSFLQSFLANYWNQFYGTAVNNSFATAAGNIMNLFVALGQLQQKGAVLLYNCFMVASPQQTTLANQVFPTLAANMKQQYLQFLADSPTMMALYNMAPLAGATVQLHLADPVAGDAPTYIDPFAAIYIRDPNNISQIVNTTSNPAARTASSTVQKWQGSAADGAQLYSILYTPDQQNSSRFALFQSLGANVFNDRFTLQSANMLTALEVDTGDASVSGKVIVVSPAKYTQVYVLQPKGIISGKTDAWFRLIPTAQMNQYAIQLENPTDFGLPAGTQLWLTYQTYGIAGTFAQFAPANSGGNSNWTLDGTPLKTLIQWYAQFQY